MSSNDSSQSRNNPSTSPQKQQDQSLSRDTKQPINAGQKQVEKSGKSDKKFDKKRG